MFYLPKKLKSCQTIVLNYLNLQSQHIFLDIYGRILLILTHSRLKWIKAKLMANSANVKDTVIKFKEFFSFLCLPIILTMVHHLIAPFCQACEIKLTKTPTYQPEKNEKDSNCILYLTAS